MDGMRRCGRRTNACPTPPSAGRQNADSDPAPTPERHLSGHEGRKRRFTMSGWLSRTSRLERRAAHAFRLKNYRAAIRRLEELVEHVGENPNTLHVLGLCHERLGADDAALGYAKRAITADANHFEALRLLIRLRERSGRHDKALALVERALACVPPPVEPRGLGKVVHLLFRDDDASLTGYDRELRDWIRWARAFIERDSDAQRDEISSCKT